MKAIERTASRKNPGYHTFRDRRGSLLATQPYSEQLLKRVFIRMLDATTLQGESRLLRTVFSH
jgi:hypothetical protein